MASTQPGASSGNGDVSPGGSGSNNANPKMRKRTKTGCLTCRKRRIKCGEERPTCGNCIKSKRQCEGYNQRVVFKPPMGDWPNHPGVVSTIQYHNSMLPGTRTSYRGNQPSGPDPASNPTQQRQFDFSHVETPVPVLHQINNQSVLVGGPAPYSQDPTYQQPLHSPIHQQPLHSPHHLPTSTGPQTYFPSQPSPVHANYPPRYTQEGIGAYPSQQRLPHGGESYQQIPVSYDTQADIKSAVSQAPQEQPLYQHQQQQQQQQQPPIHEQNYYPPHSGSSSQADSYPQYASHRPSMDLYNGHSQAPVQQPLHSPVNFTQPDPYSALPAISSHSTFQIPQHDASSDVKFLPQHAPVLEQPVAVSQNQQTFQPQILLSGFGGEDHVSPTQILDEAAVEVEDDDYWDVHSDEEMLDEDDDDDDDEEEEDGDEHLLGPKPDLALIHKIQQENTSETAIRGYHTFIYDGILTHYRAEDVANPLKNPKTARVFNHFVHVTGPSLSIYERAPRNPGSLFDGPVPPAHQSLWTYTLPLKALNNQGLLHAMLALASLHIAKLQRASVTPSYKHYAYALKRLGRSLGNPKKRLQIPTLATSLLLAFYEVMTAEHIKWSTHLVGAAHLLSEVDFRSLTQEARRVKAAQNAEERQFPYQNPDMLIDQKQFQQRLESMAMAPDESLVSTIIGKKVSYDDFGKVIEEGATKPERKKTPPGKFDLRHYETLQDLYWFYARNDAFQSIISGNPLIMDYSKWSDCPPRTPLGRADALYGSHDHIILLIGRIADFTVRDRGRKIRQMDANGGHWIPTAGIPGMGNMGPPPAQASNPHGGPPPGWTGPPPPGWKGNPSQGGGQSQGPPGPPSAAGPGFFGMAPSKPPASLPSSYINPNATRRSYSPGSSDQSRPTTSSLAEAYEVALSDWNSIAHAHATVAKYLANSASFQPLSSDLVPPPPGGVNSNTAPFGPPLLYRSFDISILWSLLHLSQILLLRSHPGMPPAATVAASICASATQPYAILIGRITSGMHLPPAEVPLTPSLGAALVESTMSLFFAGVQYTDASQREWYVTRLTEIDRRTGWASAGVIARAVETSWEKMAELGRGPPYERRTRRFGQGEETEVTVDGESSWARGDRGRWEGEERRFVMKYRDGLVPWAMNLLGTDEDLRLGMERVGIHGEINAAGTEMELVKD
ncbi:fungal-specific transcription factor domain-containing protein [Dendryphion nanum]|uniref:Fungal-specific transcription factor domain-containing protein n=1 Tax=Dendryphion nanum TaxID=256645 RepID=A0A9P9IG73_9PLEO|nr:fungal-specific transcription factor domain-containing protein [Dendryphion nanum]